jgi:arylsulfatase A
MMPIKEFCLAAALLCSTPVAAEEWTPQTPDIYLIDADDMGHRDYDTPKIPTPNIDTLADEGMAFTKARSATSVCAPTRYGIETGRYSWRVATPTQWLNNPPEIPSNVLTIEQMLKAEGYTTYTFGKWHGYLEWPTTDSNPPNATWSNVIWTDPIVGPLDQGYDYFFGGRIDNTPGSFIENDMVAVEPTSWGLNWKGQNILEVPGWDPRAYNGAVIDKLIEKVEGAGDGPIFIHYQPIIPHQPVLPEEQFLNVSNADRYGDFVAQLDSYVGRIMDAIDERGRPAVVFFTSDNGSHGRKNINGSVGSVKTCCNHDPSGIQKGWKASIYEGGVRVPFIVWWPGVVPSGETDDEVLSTDFLRTFARIVGHTVPSGQAIDSFDFWPSAVPGIDRSGPQRVVSILQNQDGDYSLVNTVWKVNQQANELYDLDSDPGESNNLWSTNVNVRNTLLGVLNDAKASSATYPSF